MTPRALTPQIGRQIISQLQEQPRRESQIELQGFRWWDAWDFQSLSGFLETLAERGYIERVRSLNRTPGPWRATPAGAEAMTRGDFLEGRSGMIGETLETILIPSPLRTEFGVHGHWLRQIWREGDIAIYERALRKDKPAHELELVVINIAKECLAGTSSPHMRFIPAIHNGDAWPGAFRWL